MLVYSSTWRSCLKLDRKEVTKRLLDALLVLDVEDFTESNWPLMASINLEKLPECMLWNLQLFQIRLMHSCVCGSL